MTSPPEIQTGPCSPWTDAESILACGCDDLNTDVDLDVAAEAASEVLYELSGHVYTGVCEATVRPCSSLVSCWVPYSDAWTATDCSCVRQSRIRLAGYPVREILEVMIDGEVIDPSEYELRFNRELYRMADADGVSQRWPGCQRMDLPLGEVGTFSVVYEYGLDAPVLGQSAAAQLACAIAKACPNSGAASGDCEIPAGTVRVARQGITIDTQALGLWLLGSLRTGMPLVDSFLSVYGGRPRQRRAALMVPEQDPWPVRVS